VTGVLLPAVTSWGDPSARTPSRGAVWRTVATRLGADARLEGIVRCALQLLSAGALAQAS
jgi:hypothetical protein